MKQRMLTGFLTVCLIFVLASPFAFAANEDAIDFRKIDDREYFRLDDLTACSDITVEQADTGVFLTEDGLRIQMLPDSMLVYRDGYIVASMSHTPILEGGLWYASSDFYEEFLCRGNSSAPSLFNGTLFFADEVLSALYAMERSPLHQKLLDAISLPVSMGIKKPHIDIERVFIKTLLSEYPAALASEMKKLGYENASTLSYSEYKVITGAQSLVSAGITPSYPELQDVDPAKMTVAQYSAWQRSYHAQQFEESLSDPVLRFLTQKDITVFDLSYLNKYYYGAYTEQTDEALMETLVGCYAADISYLKNMVNPFSDVKSGSWYFDDIIFVYNQNMMMGTSAITFDPNELATRGQVVTILWRLEGRPAVNYAMSFDDVNDGLYYGEAVRWACAEGIVGDYEKEKFGPDDAVTREQFASILWRYAKYRAYDVNVAEETNILKYDDACDVSEYAVSAMEWACGGGIMSGTTVSTLSPQEKATRAQTAAMLQRFCQLVNAD